MQKVILSLIRITLLLCIVSLISWHFANEHIRAHYLPWVSNVVRFLWSDPPPAYFALPIRVKNEPTKEVNQNLAKTIFLDQAGLLPVACKKPETKPVETTTTKVYQWIDQEGKVQFSDQPPLDQTTQAQSTSFESTKQFQINLDTTKASPPPFVKSRLEAQLKQIHRYLSQELNIKAFGQVQLNLKLFDSKTLYDNFQQQLAPSLGNTSGFYSPQENIAAIHTANYQEQTFAITRHESTHAIIASVFGPTPVWFNEGLAEVFENLEIEGQSRKLARNDAHLKKILKQPQPPSLSSIWSVPHEQWYDDEKDMRYAISWALTFYLLSDQEGKAVVNKMMNTWLDKPCHHFSTTNFFDQHWPGGSAALEAQWHIWLRNKGLSHLYF